MSWVISVPTSNDGCRLPLSAGPAAGANCADLACFEGRERDAARPAPAS
ncbi:hypothetical protein BDD41_1529 [Paracoccus versutus]|uniref:Uncharacterized protein n=1 Tax=Paracoccus versutus TaxID=34007 RepID=A0A3D9XRF0_PARVE|nr:hypothetical protein BDD41_1529 [Paracoccus versutus]